MYNCFNHYVLYHHQNPPFLVFKLHSPQSLLVLLMVRMVGSVQLFKSLCPIPSPEPTILSVQATFSAKPSSLTNGEDGRLYTTV